MAKEFNNAAIVAKDNDGNKAIVRGGSQEDWEKVGKGLQQIGNLNTAVTELIDRVNGTSSAPEVVDANNAQKGITLLTDDPTANKDAATGVTAATPKALQTAVADLKEELAEATVELNDANNTQKGITLLTDDPKANKDAATGVTAATPKAIQAAVAELQEQIADVTVELEDGSDVQKGVVFLTDDPNAEKDAATGVTAATPKAIQDALAAFQEKIESGEVAGPSGGTGGGSGSGSEGGEEGGGGNTDPAAESGDIGKPTDLGFGVGVAPKEVYESLGLKPLPDTNAPDSFQYGLYEAKSVEEVSESNENYVQTYHAYLKYIPKCYHCFLSTDDETLMDEGQLQELEQYTGLTVAQMQEAQRRGGTSAIAIAPASAFENEADANAHGFILNRGYYDDGKEKPGFFIANTLTSYSSSSPMDGGSASYAPGLHFYCGAPSFNFEPEYTYPYNHRKGLASLTSPPIQSSFSATPYDGHMRAFTIGRKFKGLNCMSVGMWQVIRMICYAAGLYCEDSTQCAWYAEGYNAAPCGINTATGQDDRVPEVTSSPIVGSATGGVVWVDNEKFYPYTTHNGRINGITNCNGWGSVDACGIAGTKVLGEDITGTTVAASLNMKLANLTKFGDEPFEQLFLWQKTVGHSSQYWGTAPFNQPLSRSLSHDAGWALSFAVPLWSAANGINPSTQFDSANTASYFATSLGLKLANNAIFSIADSNVDFGQQEGNSAANIPFRIGGYPEV